MPVLPALALQVLMTLSTSQGTIKTPIDFEKGLDNLRDDGVREGMVAYIHAKGGPKGMNPQLDLEKVILGIEVPGATDVQAKLVPDGQTISLSMISPGAFAGIAKCHFGDAYSVEYYADGNKIGDTKRFELYNFPPEMVTNLNVPKGELLEMPKFVSKVYPNSQSDWWVYKPAKPAPEGGYGLIVFQDGQGAKNYAPTCLDNMIAKGDIPPCIAIFISPSVLIESKRSIRSRQYDVLSPEYTHFILDEYEPATVKALGVTISQDPAKRCLAGVSSGGICAWTACWERPDKFGLAMSWVGSFTDIASGESKKEGGHNYPFLIRKTEKKPIRIFMQDGDQDLDNEHGNWFLCAEQMVAALKFKGYDYMWRPGHGFHSDTQGRSLMPEALRFLFNGAK